MPSPGGEGRERGPLSAFNRIRHPEKAELKILDLKSAVSVVARSLIWISAVFLVTGQLAAADFDWHKEAGARWRDLKIGGSARTGFERLDARATGIVFTNMLADERSITNRNLLSGSGVALGDVDGDGLCDIYFCGLDNHNVLYRNLGNWKFEDITVQAGVGCPNQDSTGAVFADIDGDGDVDLLVNSLGGGTRIFRNDGKAHFQEITEPAGVASKAASMSMALADIDGDGTLDLYVTNFRRTTIQDQPQTRFRIRFTDGKPVVALVNDQPATAPDLTNRFFVTPSGNVLEYGEPDALYRNDGKGRFTTVSFTGGWFLDEDGQPLPEPPRDWGLAVQFHDLNGDGAPDIYVCNDLFTPDRIWINNGRGKFRALDRLSLRSTSTFSMGVDFADLDRDGNVDFFVVDMLSRERPKQHLHIGDSVALRRPVTALDYRPQLLRNTLQMNRGDGTFAETAYYSGVEASDWSWCPIFLDVDLDGFEDILVNNGQLRDFQNVDMANRVEATKAGKQLSGDEIMNLIKLFPGLETRNLIFRNRGDRTFEEVGAAWGFNTIGISQGMALADLDNDGDLDVVMNNLHEAAGVYRNLSAAPRLAVRLKGASPNTQGIGAKIKVSGGPVPQSQEVICGGRYLSGDDPVRVFAAGSLTNQLRIEVSWRSGKQSLVGAARANRLYEIDEAGSAEVQTSNFKFQNATAKVQNAEVAPMFEDVSHLLQHVHHDEPFDDFEAQPLLPNLLSQLGPGVCWHDVDGDGWDDLVIGSGRGGQLGLFHNERGAGFTPVASPVANRPVTRDQTTVLGLSFGLVIGSANYEDGSTNGGCIRIFDLNRQAAGDSVLGHPWSAGPLALGDVDGDGDLDLFIGGRVVARRYPEPAPSLLMKYESGKLLPGQRWEKMGLASGAVFSDLNGDGHPDLVVACEWGPVRVFINEQGTLKEMTRELGLADLTGWWNGVTTGDIDGDGRLDIIATNWGLNHKYRTSRKHPRRLYYGDLDGNGTMDLIEAYFEMDKEVPERGFRAVAAALPFILQTIPTYETYGNASLAEIFGDKLKQTQVVEANTLTSMIFFNRGDHFQPVPLPAEAQWSPAFGVCVGDLDGDGNEDIFLSQNFFGANAESSRYDAGRGLWLRGDGKGGLTPMPAQESGVKIYGEQRGCALADYDGDGRVDLVVAQNGAATKLYHNLRARPGLRVRLRGGAANPTAVGAALRLIFGERLGPVREIHAGAGYWSQDSAVQVLGTPTPPTGIWVRWPGGRTLTADVPASAREIEVNEEGKVKVLH
jgi:hypothetical protein